VRLRFKASLESLEVAGQAYLAAENESRINSSDVHARLMTAVAVFWKTLNRALPYAPSAAMSEAILSALQTLLANSPIDFHTQHAVYLWGDVGGDEDQPCDEDVNVLINMAVSGLEELQDIDPTSDPFTQQMIVCLGWIKQVQVHGVREADTHTLLLVSQMLVIVWECVVSPADQERFFVVHSSMLGPERLHVEYDVQKELG
jgi:hypothetical protein